MFSVRCIACHKQAQVHQVAGVSSFPWCPCGSTSFSAYVTAPNRNFGDSEILKAILSIVPNIDDDAWGKISALVNRVELEAAQWRAQTLPIKVEHESKSEGLEHHD